MNLIVREKDEATKNLEANIAKNQAYLDEQYAKIAAMTNEERKAHNEEIAEKARKFYSQPENALYTR